MHIYKNIDKIADWGCLRTQRQFQKEFGVKYKGEGWYLLTVLGDPCAILVELRSDNDLEVRGWWVKDRNEAMSFIGGGGVFREEEF